jgi:hypothetical protein
MNEEMERPPWWLSESNGDNASGNETGDAADPGIGGGLGDVWSLLGMVGNIAGDWLAASGASEHADHGDPREHPDCLVCKVFVGVQSVTQPAIEPEQLPRARWLPVRRA